MDKPVRLMVLGLVGLILGVVLPFLMVLRVIEPGFVLSFIAYGASLSGLFLGLLGVVSYTRIERQKRRDPWDK
jgi:hypothetical protein